MSNEQIIATMATNLIRRITHHLENSNDDYETVAFKIAPTTCAGPAVWEKVKTHFLKS